MSETPVSTTHELEHEILQADTLQEAVQRSMVAAAQCWDDPTKAGEFHPGCAENIGVTLLEFLTTHFEIRLKGVEEANPST